MVAGKEAGCTDVLTVAGLLPGHGMGLAEVMVALGIASQAGGVWSMPVTLPTSEDELPLARTRISGPARLQGAQGRPLEG